MSDQHTLPTLARPGACAGDAEAAAGWAWATCPNDACGYSTGRDNAAWQRIGARGLTHQHKTSLDRTAGTFVIRCVVEALDRAGTVQQQTRDRTKSGPTAKRPVPGKRRRLPTPPDNRTPARARPGGKRPAGRTPTHPTRRSRRCPRQQGPNTIGTPARHRPDGAGLGAGFHRHAHTTPTRGQPWPSHLPARSRTPGITQEPQADERRSRGSCRAPPPTKATNSAAAASRCARRSGMSSNQCPIGRGGAAPATGPFPAPCIASSTALIRCPPRPHHRGDSPSPSRVAAPWTASADGLCAWRTGAPIVRLDRVQTHVPPCLRRSFTP